MGLRSSISWRDLSISTMCRHHHTSQLGLQIIPREFERVISKLDEFCGEEEFEKARVSIDWMDKCLKNFTKDYELEFCSRNKSYLCAIDPQSDGCLQSQSEALPGKSR
jgi:hypothetical protein